MSLQDMRKIINRRNDLRSGCLPKLNTLTELKRMKRLERAQAFNRFAEPLRPALIEAEIERWQVQSGNPNWKPNSILGMGIGARVDALLYEQYRAMKQL